MSSNALNSVGIILKNKVQIVTFPFFFIVKLQNFLNAPRILPCCFLILYLYNVVHATIVW